MNFAAALMAIFQLRPMRAREQRGGLAAGA
jgi:hypothetical protein